MRAKVHSSVKLRIRTSAARAPAGRREPAKAVGQTDYCPDVGTITTYYTLYRGADLRRFRTMANRRPCGGARAIRSALASARLSNTGIKRLNPLIRKIFARKGVRPKATTVAAFAPRSRTRRPMLLA